MKTKISFDYDSTLSESWVQLLVSLLINTSEIWIVTARGPGKVHNKDLYKVAEKFGIPEDRIIFTDGGMKWSVLKHYSLDYHFDDMPEEVYEINNQTNCKGILVGLQDTEDLWTLFQNQQIQNKKE